METSENNNSNQPLHELFGKLQESRRDFMDGWKKEIGRSHPLREEEKLLLESHLFPCVDSISLYFQPICGRFYYAYSQFDFLCWTDDVYIYVDHNNKGIEKSEWGNYAFEKELNQLRSFYFPDGGNQKFRADTPLKAWEDIKCIKNCLPAAMNALAKFK